MIAVKFAELRKQRGFSQRKLSAAAHVPNSTIIAIERGAIRIKNITLENAKRLSDALGVTMEELLNLEEGD